MATEHGQLSQQRRWWRVGLVLLLVLALLVSGCETSGDINDLTPTNEDSTIVEQLAAQSLITQFGKALQEEDIDRVQELLASSEQTNTPRGQGTTGQEEDAAFENTQAYLERTRRGFLTSSVTDFLIPPETIQIATDRRSLSFLAVVSELDPIELVQRTHRYSITFRLIREEQRETATYRIVSVKQEEPEVEVITMGQVLSQVPARVKVKTGLGPVRSVTVEVPETGVIEELVDAGNVFHSSFIPPRLEGSEAAPLRVHIKRDTEVLVVNHAYRLRVVGGPVVQKIQRTGEARFEAVAVAPDGTTWVGGSEPMARAGGTLYKVLFGDSNATLVTDLFRDDSTVPVPEDLVSVTDLVFDRLGRLHIIFEGVDFEGDRQNGSFVVEPTCLEKAVNIEDCFCQTLDISDENYPFEVHDPVTGKSPSSQALAAESFAADKGDVWLFGSDGGMAQAKDTFQQNGVCPDTGSETHYASVFRREDGKPLSDTLLSNTVLALVEAKDTALWIGTIFGLTRLKTGKFTPVPFSRERSFQGKVATLEAFFRELAEALFEARPLTTVQLGGVSFVQEFGQALVKEDLIFSAVEVQQELWVGTLGGGLRRIDARATPPQDTLHLTRQDGLSSNTIFALAVQNKVGEGKQKTPQIWAATLKGIDRIDTETSTITATFSALDGLPARAPIFDVAVDDEGTVWLATEVGLFRLLKQGGRVQGEVQERNSHPVEGADVIAFNNNTDKTPFRTVTDDAGRFTLYLPPGDFFLDVDGQLAVGGPFVTILPVSIEVSVGAQILENPIIVRRN